MQGTVQQCDFTFMRKGKFVGGRATFCAVHCAEEHQEKKSSVLMWKTEMNHSVG